MRKFITTSLLLSVLCILLTGCGNDQKRMLGNWEPVGQYDESVFYNSFELLEDGTMITDGYNCKYSIEDGKFVVTFLWRSESYGYKLKGSTLTLTSGEQTATYQKQ